MTENDRLTVQGAKIAQLGSWELDLVNNILVWSDEIYEIFGVEPQSFGATYEAFLSFVHPEDREMIDVAYTESVKTKAPYGPITHRLISADGSVKFVEERGQTEYDAKGTPVKSMGVVQDVTERILGSDYMEPKEKEILLKEIYHRVKNNLQLVSSIMSIQSSRIDNPEMSEIFLTCLNRIQTISLIHQQLYSADNLAQIKIQDHLNVLLENIYQTMNGGRDIRYKVSFVPGSIHMEKAVPMGLIFNEIISNSFKHAFGKEGGEIAIDIQQNNDGWNVHISDNGIGSESPEALIQSGNLGIDIIESLVEQLDGAMEIQTSLNKGVRYHLTFP